MVDSFTCLSSAEENFPDEILFYDTCLLGWHDDFLRSEIERVFEQALQTVDNATIKVLS